jgi:two-component system chemotaxis sensor kinase CheA
MHAFVIGAGPAAVGVLVDRISGQREIVVKTLRDPLVKVAGISGATELGDGRLVLILDAAGLVRKVRGRATTAPVRAAI